MREKILHSAARHVVTAAEDKKFLASFTWPVPVEVHPFAYHIVRKKLHDDFGGLPNTRMLKESYPYVTENGNFIFDTKFDFRARVSDIRGYETKLKNIPGVVEVGLFTKRSGTYYKAKFDGSFERLEVP